MAELRKNNPFEYNLLVKWGIPGAPSEEASCWRATREMTDREQEAYFRERNKR